MSTDQALTMRVSEQAGYAVVVAAGSIDAITRDLLDEQLDRALELTRLAVIVDLSEVGFCDSTGLDTFVQARRKATARGVTMVIVGLRNRVEYVFTITQLEEAFFAQPDLETAIRWLENGSTGQADYLPLATESEHEG
jgi:anti-sigma B factor antagonist